MHDVNVNNKSTLVANIPPVKARSVYDKIAISGSGNSRNVLNGVNVAANIGATAIGLTGFAGDELKDAMNTGITLPSDSMEQIEDVHLLLRHLVTTGLRNIVSGDV